MATLQTLPEATTLLPSESQPGATVLAARSFFYAVFKHGRLVIGTFLLVFLASAIAGLTRPQTWRAETRVLVKLGETVQLAPAEAPSRSVTLPLNQEVVRTEAEIVKSWEVVREAMQRIGLTPPAGASVAEMVQGMQGALTVTPQAGSNVLRISYLGRDPERAAKTVNAITDVYLEHHNRVYRSEGFHDFYSAQLRLLETEMRKAQKRLRDYQREKDITDIDQELQLLNIDVIEQEKGLRRHRAKIRSAEEKITEVQAQFDRLPSDVAFSEEYLANPTSQTYKNQLAQLEIERASLLQRFLPADRHVRDKEEEIGLLRRRIREEEERILSKRIVRRSPLRDELARNIIGHQVMLRELRSRDPGLAARYHESKKELRRLRDRRFVIMNLKQDAEQKAYAFDLYRKKSEEARVSEAMKTQSMVNVSVVDHANAPLKPENGLLLPLLVGLLGGAALAAAMAVAVEYVNRRLRFEEEVERYLELPVLAVIPDLETTTGVARA